LSNTLASGNAVRKGSKLRAALESRSYHHEKAPPVTLLFLNLLNLGANATQNKKRQKINLKRKGDLIKGVTGEFTASYDELLNARAAAGRQQNLALTGPDSYLKN